MDKALIITLITAALTACNYDVEQCQGNDCNRYTVHQDGMPSLTGEQWIQYNKLIDFIEENEIGDQVLDQVYADINAKYDSDLDLYVGVVEK